MLRKFLDHQLKHTAPGTRFERLHPVVEAIDAFLYEPPNETSSGPHVRDSVDVKRVMMLVVFALLPCILMAIWNTGLQSFVYSSGNLNLMQEYLSSATSFGGYFGFVFHEFRFLEILRQGFTLFLPVMFISYLVGGLCEAVFAVVRRHPISEGFLVTGMLYALILPPTLPYWMVAFGIAVGVILSKEVFGGSGMNIVNPALACRAFLYFTFPGRMSGEVWVGSSVQSVRESLLKMNRANTLPEFDGYTQATWLAQFKIPTEIKQIHVDAIASNDLLHPSTLSALQEKLSHWNQANGLSSTLGSLSSEHLHSFVTATAEKGGLGLPPNLYTDAARFAALENGVGHSSNWNLFFGDRLGSMGETSVFACLLGAAFLLFTRIASWRTMMGMLLGAFVTALLFQLGAGWIGSNGGAWNPAIYGFPAYKHLLLGGLPFGIVFMVTDPVSSPTLPLARWVYGAFAGVVTILIRVINPAYPEGVMLAILMANVFAPLFDRMATHRLIQKRRTVRVRQ